MGEIEVERFCVRGCTRDDGSGLVARHGAYCARCHGRIRTALLISGELAGHLLHHGVVMRTAEAERVDSSSEAPVPFNAAAFDDVNELYSLLVYWVTVWAGTLRQPVPGVAVRAWRSDTGRIIGLPRSTSPVDGQRLVSGLAGWLGDRLDAILSADRPDDVDAMSDAVRDVWRMNARWPRIERPSYSAMPCPRQDCGARIAVYPPTFEGDDRRVVCTAGHWYPEEEYEHLIRVFEQVKREEAKTARVAKRLAKRYGIGATT